MLIAVEFLSVFFNLLYIYFAIRQKSVSWIFGIIAALLSAWLFFQNRYIGSALLNLVYAMLGLFGFFQWQFILKDKLAGYHLSFKKHILLLNVLAVIFLFTILFFREYHFNVWVKLDILLAFGSILATYLEIKKDTSCWYYWIILNTGFMIVYSLQHLYAYALLMAFLGIFYYFALREWQKIK